MKTTTHTPTLIQKIRLKTRQIHDELEALPFAQSIINENIPLEKYLNLLQQLFHIHLQLEDCLQKQLQFHLLLTPSTQRSHIIKKDLQYFNQPQISEPLTMTSRFLSWLQSVHKNAPYKILGTLYVMEGSRMGSAILKKHLANALNIEPKIGNGLDYHMEGVQKLGLYWKQFCCNLDEFVPKNYESDVIDGAFETMKQLHSIYEQLGALNS